MSLDIIRSVFVVEYMGLNFLGCLKLQCSVYCLHSTPHNHGILGGGGGGEGGSEASPRLDTPVFGMHFPRPAPIRCTALHRLVCCCEDCQGYYCVACDDVSFPQHSQCLRQSIRETQLPWMSEVSLYAV